MDVADAEASADVVAGCDACNDGDNYLDDDDKYDEPLDDHADAVASADGVVLRVDELEDAAPHHVVRRPTENLCDDGADSVEDALGVDHGQQVLGILPEPVALAGALLGAVRKASVKVTQCRLGAPALGDVVALDKNTGDRKCNLFAVFGINESIDKLFSGDFYRNCVSHQGQICAFPGSFHRYFICAKYLRAIQKSHVFTIRNKL